MMSSFIQLQLNHNNEVDKSLKSIASKVGGNAVQAIAKAKEGFLPAVAKVRMIQLPC